MSQDDSKPIRRWRVRVEAAGYATTFGATRKEAVENARKGTFLRTPRPDWRSLVSDVTEIKE